MALPKLLQKLFTNGGAGDKLNPDIIPAMTGTLVVAQGNNSITGSASDYFVQINAAGNSGGGQLRLYGKDNTQYPGWIFLYVKSGNEPEKALVLKGTGGLEWDGKPVLCGESGGFPVGFLALYAGSNVPDGWFRCDGSTIADMATNYPKLYAVLGTNVLPNYSGRVPLGATADINTKVDAGLPNITGKAGESPSGFNTGGGDTFAGSCSGAFTGVKMSITGGHSTGTQNAWSYLTFDASKSNSLYGKSTTVMPPAVKVAVLIKHD